MPRGSRKLSNISVGVNVRSKAMERAVLSRRHFGFHLSQPLQGVRSRILATNNPGRCEDHAYGLASWSTFRVCVRTAFPSMWSLVGESSLL